MAIWDWPLVHSLPVIGRVLAYVRPTAEAESESVAAVRGDEFRPGRYKSLNLILDQQHSSRQPSEDARPPSEDPTGDSDSDVAQEQPRTEEDEAKGALEALSMLLEPYRQSVLPEHARTRPGITQKEQEPMTLLGWWKYVPFVALQSAVLTKAFLKHMIYGPPRPSWGLELSLLTAFLQEVSQYSYLSSVTYLRTLLDLGSHLPLPQNGMVTPFCFPVRRLGLTGFLADADARETGARNIKGEWVVNKHLWNKLQKEFVENNRVGKDRVILFLHGGAYYVLSAEAYRPLTMTVSRYTEARVFAINYRLAPETRFPGQLHDVVVSYFRLIDDLCIPPENIIFVGDSAGGGLTLATLMYLRDEGYPLPAGAIVMSPWVDLTMSCASWTTNRAFDFLPSPRDDDHLNPVRCFLGNDGMENVTHPYASPLFGSFTGLPPLLIQAGEAEVLRDEITLLAHKAALDGVQVEHELYIDCVHVFQVFFFLEASRIAFQNQRAFVQSLAAASVNTRQPMDGEIVSDARLVHSADTERANVDTVPSDAALPVVSEGQSPAPVSIPPASKEPPTRTRSASAVTPRKSIFTFYSTPTSPTGAKHSFLDDEGSTPAPRRRADTASSTGYTRKRAYTSATPSRVVEQTSDHVKLPLKTRISSHPDFLPILRTYEENGPSNRTKVFGKVAPMSRITDD